MKLFLVSFSALVSLAVHAQISAPGREEKVPVMTNFRMWGGISGSDAELDGNWQLNVNETTESNTITGALGGGVGMHLGVQIEMFDILHADVLWQGGNMNALRFPGIIDQRIQLRNLRFRVGVDLLQNDMFSWYFFMGIHQATLDVNTLKTDSTGAFITESLVFRSKVPNFNMGTGAMMFFKDESAGIIFEVGYQDAALKPHEYSRYGDGAGTTAPTGDLTLRAFEGRIGLAVRLNTRK
ncbi:MAG: hypothetical protein JNM00_14495 [Flavobacteriales bacterium]|nr:hypothetical protein [Flavobacteriales bacterium]